MTEPNATQPRDHWVLRLDPDTPLDRPVARPFHIDSRTGGVLGWRLHDGDPVHLLGFSDQGSGHTIRLSYTDRLAGDLGRAVGLHPVFAHRSGEVATHPLPIASARRVIWADVTPNAYGVKNVRLRCGHVATVVTDRDDDTRLECATHGLTTVRRETGAARDTVLLNEPELSTIYARALDNRGEGAG